MSRGRFYAFTPEGLEGVAAGEIAARLRGARVGGTQRGVVFFEYGGEEPPLLLLRTCEDVFALVCKGELSPGPGGPAQLRRLFARSPHLERALEVHHRLRPRKGKRPSFRVVAQRRSGRHAYERRALHQSLVRAVQARFPGWKAVAEDAALEFWVLQESEKVLCGLRLSDRSMRHRTYKKAHIPASLRPVVAHSMALLSQPGEDDVFLDPMCGAGTLLIERGECGRYGRLLGGDLRSEALAACRRNLGPRYKPISIARWDAGALPLAEASVDCIGCNLPFGLKVGIPLGLEISYGNFAREAARVLRDGGRMVLLSAEKELLAGALKACRELKIHRVFTIVLLGRKASVFQVGRRGRQEPGRKRL